MPGSGVVSRRSGLNGDLLSEHENPGSPCGALALGHIGTVAFLWSIGGSAIFAVVLRALTKLSWQWIVVLAVGLACIILALIVAYRRSHRRRTSDTAVPEGFVLSGWNATCRSVSGSLGGPFGRGVRLSIENNADEERDLRCIVTGSDGTRYRSVQRLSGFTSSPSSRDSFHWPGEFDPKPETPWMPGSYSYVWSGDTGDIADDESEALARQYFRVDENEIITCT